MAWMEKARKFFCLPSFIAFTKALKKKKKEINRGNNRLTCSISRDARKTGRWAIQNIKKKKTVSVHHRSFKCWAKAFSNAIFSHFRQKKKKKSSPKMMMWFTVSSNISDDLTVETVKRERLGVQLRSQICKADLRPFFYIYKIKLLKIYFKLKYNCVIMLCWSLLHTAWISHT